MEPLPRLHQSLPDHGQPEKFQRNVPDVPEGGAIWFEHLQIHREKPGMSDRPCFDAFRLVSSRVEEANDDIIGRGEETSI